MSINESPAKPGVTAAWDTDNLNVAQPSNGQIASGWLFQQIPPSNFFNWILRNIGLWLAWATDRIDRLPGSNPDALTFPGAGGVEPTQGNIKIVATGPGDPDLVAMDVTFLGDGRFVTVRGDDADPCTIRHMAGGPGQIKLADGLDITLKGTDYITFQQQNDSGSAGNEIWAEVSRSLNISGGAKSFFAVITASGNWHSPIGCTNITTKQLAGGGAGGGGGEGSAPGDGGAGGVPGADGGDTSVFSGAFAARGGKGGTNGDGGINGVGPGAGGAGGVAVAGALAATSKKLGTVAGAAGAPGGNLASGASGSGGNGADSWPEPYKVAAGGVGGVGRPSGNVAGLVGTAGAIYGAGGAGGSGGSGTSGDANRYAGGGGGGGACGEFAEFSIDIPADTDIAVVIGAGGVGGAGGSGNVGADGGAGGDGSIGFAIIYYN